MTTRCPELGARYRTSETRFTARSSIPVFDSIEMVPLGIDGMVFAFPEGEAARPLPQLERKSQ